MTFWKGDLTEGMVLRQRDLALKDEQLRRWTIRAGHLTKKGRVRGAACRAADKAAARLYSGRERLSADMLGAETLCA